MGGPSNIPFAYHARPNALDDGPRFPVHMRKAATLTTPNEKGQAWQEMARHSPSTVLVPHDLTPHHPSAPPSAISSMSCGMPCVDHHRFSVVSQSMLICCGALKKVHSMSKEFPASWGARQGSPIQPCNRLHAPGDDPNPPSLLSAQRQHYQRVARTAPPTRGYA